MPYYEKAEDWLHQSALLLQARPSTTRVTTRYHLKPARRIPKSKKQQQDASQTTIEQQSKPQQQDQNKEKPPRGHLVLKTFDPHSGITLKYKTSKAAEVGRLVQMLGSLGKGMAGLKMSQAQQRRQQQQEEEDVVMGDVSGGAGAGGGGGVLTSQGGEGSGMQTPHAVEKQLPQGSSVQHGGGGGGGGKGKKKKGKR
ncbi:hypothetical protein N657DRAFT_619276 [Parathielavia appendiculata]|uniref:SRP9 domain-containing protein n=1 Tax=Parathielavia appendiculata TaxID=2587402 RepID=A0AAN6U109_9PEZI|nr:hypothetical protein N657DRAFT_619276 [Parathielavia appendiculata]